MLAEAEAAAVRQVTGDAERAGCCTKLRLFIKDDSAQGEGISRALGLVPKLQHQSIRLPIIPLRPLLKRRSMVGLVITIAQRKGGAGKTTLATQFAVTWARRGARVAALDIDPQGSFAAEREEDYGFF
jgi:Mrp family chromosome partitioning ATPase